MAAIFLNPFDRRRLCFQCMYAKCVRARPESCCPPMRAMCPQSVTASPGIVRFVSTLADRAVHSAAKGAPKEEFGWCAVATTLRSLQCCRYCYTDAFPTYAGHVMDPHAPPRGLRSRAAASTWSRSIRVLGPRPWPGRALSSPLAKHPLASPLTENELASNALSVTQLPGRVPSSG